MTITPTLSAFSRKSSSDPEWAWTIARGETKGVYLLRTARQQTVDAEPTEAAGEVDLTKPQQPKQRVKTTSNTPVPLSDDDLLDLAAAAVLRPNVNGKVDATKAKARLDSLIARIEGLLTEGSQ